MKNVENTLSNEQKLDKGVAALKHADILGEDGHLTERYRPPVKVSKLKKEMINNNVEYQIAKQRLQEGYNHLNKQRTHLESMGFRPEEVNRAIDPLRSFYEQFAEEIQYYEQLHHKTLR